jgi:zinc transport system permease protein
LITALLIIPAAAARNYASTPERMALLSMAIGALSAIAGLRLAVIFDTTVGPAIICVAAFIFTVSAMSAALRRLRSA